MIATLKEVLAAGAPGAVGSFNVLDGDMALAIADAATALQRPTIIGVATRHFAAIRTPEIAPALRRDFVRVVRGFPGLRVNKPWVSRTRSGTAERAGGCRTVIVMWS